jgi:hypothetical protein
MTAINPSNPLASLQRAAPAATPITPVQNSQVAVDINASATGAATGATATGAATGATANIPGTAADSAVRSDSNV